MTHSYIPKWSPPLLEFTPPPCHIIIIFFFVVRTLKIYSLSNIQVYHTFLVTVIMLYIRSLELLNLITRSLYHLTRISPFVPNNPHPQSGNNHSTLFLRNSHSSLGQFIYGTFHDIFISNDLIFNTLVVLLILLQHFPPLHSSSLYGYFSQENFSSLKAEWDYSKLFPYSQF